MKSVTFDHWALFKFKALEHIVYLASAELSKVKIYRENFEIFIHTY